MITTKTDAIRIIQRARSIEMISFAQHLTNQSEALKILNDAVRNKLTILLIK